MTMTFRSCLPDWNHSNLLHLGHLSWVWPVLCRSCTAPRKGRFVSRSWSVSSDLSADCRGENCRKAATNTAESVVCSSPGWLLGYANGDVNDTRIAWWCLPSNYCRCFEFTRSSNSLAYKRKNVNFKKTSCYSKKFCFTLQFFYQPLFMKILQNTIS